MRIILSSFIALLLIHVVISGQEKVVLNLEESIKIAVKNNHSLTRVRLQEEKAEEQVNEAYGTSLFPTIDGNAEYNRAIKRPVITIETPAFSGTFPMGTKNQLNAGVSVEQPLFTGAMFLAVDIAKTYAELQKQAVKYSEAELISNVKKAYFNFLVSRELVNLSEIQLNRAERNLKDVRSLFGAGLASEYDQIQANVQFQNLKPALTEAENQRRLALNNLKLLLGLEMDDEVVIHDTLIFKDYELPEFWEGLNVLYEKNNLLKQKTLNAELQDLNASYQFTQHFPKLNAFGNWQVQAQENDDRAFNEWRYKNVVGVGLRLQVPIFHGLAISSRVDQAEIDYKIAEEELSLTRKELRAQYEEVYYTIVKNIQQVDAYEAAVKEASRGYEIASKRYRSGLGSQLEVTSSLVEFSSAKVNYLRTLSEYYSSYSNLEKLLGKQAAEVKYYSGKKKENGK